MGSAATEKDRDEDEGPTHQVTIAAFAVAKFDATFAEWDACAAQGGCDTHVGDQGWGRGQRPAINVSWDDAQRYVEWLSRLTGRSYRLLTEAEWEYAARAGTATAFSWGDGNETPNGGANCNQCGSQWDGKETAPVGSFAANRFGLHDMAGNVITWVEDCLHDNYDGAPMDGSAWTDGDCLRRVVRGGSWYDDPHDLRLANRGWNSAVDRFSGLGFRIARTLAP